MTVKMFDKHHKQTILDAFQKWKLTITDIAERLDCSETTVKRVLKEQGVKFSIRKSKQPPANVEETKKIMSLLYRYGINCDQLEAIINAPAMTASNVVKFLKESNSAQLAIILTAAGLVQTLPTLPIPKAAQQPLF